MTHSRRVYLISRFNRMKEAISTLAHLSFSDTQRLLITVHCEATIYHDLDAQRKRKIPIKMKTIIWNNRHVYSISKRRKQSHSHTSQYSQIKSSRLLIARRHFTSAFIWCEWVVANFRSHIMWYSAQCTPRNWRGPLTSPCASQRWQQCRVVGVIRTNKIKVVGFRQ